MPEYLSPAVYVEEVSTGSRPIEGVSTSTAGIVGVTERGPENVPVLVTSIGDYRRIFGGEVSLADFTDAGGRVHGHTAFAAKAFFENGGRRVFVIRVAARDARAAERMLFDRGSPGSANTLLLRAASQDSGTGLNPPLVYALGVNPPAVGDTIRIGDGSRSEYRAVAALGASIHVALGAPLGMSHAAGSGVDEVVRLVDTTNYAAGTFQLVGDVAAGAATITVSAVGNPADAAALLALPGDAAVEIGTGTRAEYRVATAAQDIAGNVRLTLSTPLALDHADTDPVSALDVSTAAVTQALDTAVAAGDALIYLDDLGGGFVTPGNLAVIEAGSATMEIRRIGTLGSATLDLPAYIDYPAGSRIERVDMDDDERSVVVPGDAGTPNTATEFDLDRVDGLAVGMEIDVAGDLAVIDAIDEATSHVTVRAPGLSGAPGNGDTVFLPAMALTGAVAAGAIVVPLDSRLGLLADDVLRIGVAPNEEYVTIGTVTGPRGVAPDAGAVILAAPLRQAHPTGSEVRRQAPPTVNTGQPPAYTVLGTVEGETGLLVTDADGYATGHVISVTLAGGVRHYHLLGAVDITLSPAELELDDALDFSHRLGAPLVGRDSLIRVVALDRGAWGDRLRIAVREPETPLVQADLTASSPLNPLISLSNYTGIEPGTVLEFFDPASGAMVGALSKVVRVDRAAGEVELAAVPDPAVTGAAVPLSVRSREFEIVAFLLQRPDPAVPSRNDTVIDSETFLVSMDTRHSRYVHRIIGTTWMPGADVDEDGTPLREWDRRSEGESRYIRVRDVAAGNQAVTESIRLGPEPLEDTLVTGLVRPARLPLADGDDAVFAMDDAMYRGLDSNEPRLRTGIQALQNELTISIVAVPGQVTVPVQQALINHCERDRYRFAVLDGPPPNRDTLVDLQLHRQQFDTNYAALYHPWVTIPDPLPGNLATIQQITLPSSGHLLGIYARTDNERGVHKAPANTVVRNITGLSRYLNQREQDILNPLGVNVTRDFRRTNRGIRVWGARCMTSDTRWKYVSVRRLIIFIEASIDRGLQWVVFEPNAEELWARVRRTIRSFLTVVWRNGALEGTSPEQAFFVKCDRTTMTQDDIDNGRLICLVGIAPVKPAEFVIVRIGLKTATAEE